MVKAMATLHFDMQQLDEQARQAMSALLPQEQEHVRELMQQGIIEAIYISTDRTLVWLVMQGESQAQLEQELSHFPLYPYMKADWKPLVT